MNGDKRFWEDWLVAFAPVAVRSLAETVAHHRPRPARRAHGCRDAVRLLAVVRDDRACDRDPHRRLGARAEAARRRGERHQPGRALRFDGGANPSGDGRRQGGEVVPEGPEAHRRARAGLQRLRDAEVRRSGPETEVNAIRGVPHGAPRKDRP